MFTGLSVSKYVGVAAVLIAASFGLPIPEEIPIVGAGALVGHDAQERAHDNASGAVGGGVASFLGADLSADDPGRTRWWVMLPVCIVAVVLGDTILFSFGRFGGSRLLNNGWVQRHVLPVERQAKIIENFHKNGILILLGARLTPGIRSPVFIMAGVLRMPFQRFLLADALYAIPGINILFWLAYIFTDQFVTAIKKVEEYRPFVIAVVLSALFGILLYKLFTSRRVSTGDLSQIPDLAKPVAGVTNVVEKAVEKAAGAAGSAAGNVYDKVRHAGRRHPDDAPHEAPAEPAAPVAPTPVAPALPAAQTPHPQP